VLGPETWDRLTAPGDPTFRPGGLAEHLDERRTDEAVPPFCADLARVEWAAHRASEDRVPSVPPENDPRLNPSLHLVETSWTGLHALRENPAAGVAARAGGEIVLVWHDRASDRIRVQEATPAQLLALKVVVEHLDPLETARQAGEGAGVVHEAVDRAAAEGLVWLPASRLRRDPAVFGTAPRVPEHLLSTRSFTLQWHVTQACDLHCRHCYDRTDRSTLTLDQGLRVLDDLYAFCRQHHVHGHVSFSGGNPLLHPRFVDLYRAAWERGFTMAILGNPSPRERLDELVAISPPDFFQVSLEGLPDHNDHIRGPGHFDRTIAFLEVLRELGIHAMVMLTLTRDNLDQVLPLGERLRGRADTFHFNRLSTVGEGANLQLPDPGEYAAFLREYVTATRKNPILGLKDNLINILRHREGLDPFGGCTGFGCGAAFNFVALLADGEVHACRKFPSPIGNLGEQRLGKVYDSPAAARYRLGCDGCGGCPVRPACGGCLASAHSFGLDGFAERDPFCFREPTGEGEPGPSV
jgi:selenobiotic family peptide radical SAM maturase